MVWVAYITSGRDKYDYFTDLVGVFNHRKDAELAMRRNLIDCGKVFSLFYEDILQEKKENSFDIDDDYYCILKKFNNFEDRYDKCNSGYQFMEEFMEDFCTSESSLYNIVEKYNDSYYQDGWEYHIDEVEIK